MDPHKTYRCLEEIAEKLNISIRYENLSNSEFSSGGGLCRIHGRYVYIMDSSTGITQRISALSQCLARMNLEGIYVVPALRELLEKPARRG